MAKKQRHEKSDNTPEVKGNANLDAPKNRVKGEVTTEIGASSTDEYLAECDKNIKKTKKAISDAKSALSEAEKDLLGENSDKYAREVLLDDFCLKRLGEVLTADELKIVEEGIPFYSKSKKVELLKGRVVDEYYDRSKFDNQELLNKIFEFFKTLPDDEKLVIAKFLGFKNILYLGFKDGLECQKLIFRPNAPEYNRAFTLGWCYSDSEGAVEGYKEIMKNLEALGILKFKKDLEDSCYRIDSDVYDESLNSVIERALSGEKGERQLEINKLKKKLKSLEKKLENFKEKRHAVERFGLPEDEAVLLFRWFKTLQGGVRDFHYDADQQVCVVLCDRSSFPEGGDTQRDSVIRVKRGKNSKSMEFKYRDAFDGYYDKPSNEYRKIKSFKVKGDQVVVVAENSLGDADSYTFDIAYEKSTLTTSKEKKFNAAVDKAIKELIAAHTKSHLSMPASDSFGLRDAGMFHSNGGYTDLLTPIPYEKAKVVYKELNPEKGEAYVTIQEHKDSTGARGRQYGLYRYIITKKGVKPYGERTFWEDNVRNGAVNHDDLQNFTNWND